MNTALWRVETLQHGSVDMHPSASRSPFGSVRFVLFFSIFAGELDCKKSEEPPIRPYRTKTLSRGLALPEETKAYVNFQIRPCYLHLTCKRKGLYEGGGERRGESVSSSSSFICSATCLSAQCTYSRAEPRLPLSHPRHSHSSFLSLSPSLARPASSHSQSEDDTTCYQVKTRSIEVLLSRAVVLTCAG